MLWRGVLNSRMKDYFDIWTLARSRPFDGPILAEAIRTTCAHRGTTVDPAPAAFSDSTRTDPSKQMQWTAFRRRLRPTDAPDSFDEVATAVARFLVPVAEAITSGVAFERTWEADGPWT